MTSLHPIKDTEAAVVGVEDILEEAVAAMEVA